MSTILIFVFKDSNLVKVIYKQGNSPKEELEEYPNSVLETKGGQVQIWNQDPTVSSDPVLVVPTSRTIIKYV